MAMDDEEHVSELVGEVVIDPDGNRVGRVTQVSYQPDTLEPEWLVVKTSRFGRERLVPLGAANEQGDVIRLAVAKDVVLAAPIPEMPVSLAPREREALVEHYRHVA
jgi:sporulation protein YlmC with PRC-barrel domain